MIGHGRSIYHPFILSFLFFFFSSRRRHTRLVSDLSSDVCSSDLKRPGHTRCVVCHTQNNAPFHLVPLTPGSSSWNEEQSRQNFQLVQKVALPGSMDSPLVQIGRASCRERV